MTEKELNEQDFYIESYAGGFIIAHYPSLSPAKAYFYGQSMQGRTQPIIPDPFPFKDAAIKAASEFVLRLPVIDNA